MNPQELSQKVEQLEYTVKDLVSKSIEYKNKFNKTETSSVNIDRFISQDSKDVIVQSVRWFERRSDISVVAGFTLSPYSQYLKVTADAARTSDTTIAIRDGNYVGQRLYIEGTSDTNTVTITDNANTLMAGNVILGMGDTISFLWNGTDWLELGRSNN